MFDKKKKKHFPLIKTAEKKLFLSKGKSFLEKLNKLGTTCLCSLTKRFICLLKKKNASNVIFGNLSLQITDYCQCDFHPYKESSAVSTM